MVRIRGDKPIPCTWISVNPVARLGQQTNEQNDPCVLLVFQASDHAHTVHNIALFPSLRAYHAATHHAATKSAAVSGANLAANFAWALPLLMHGRAWDGMARAVVVWGRPAIQDQINFRRQWTRATNLIPCAMPFIVHLLGTYTTVAKAKGCIMCITCTERQLAF